MSHLLTQIRQKGYQLGFSDIAVCSADPLPEATWRLNRWLEDGFQGSMDWMQRTSDIRGNPRGYFPAARSILVATLNYFDESEILNRPESEANISIYARGRDYHKVLRKKLKALLSYIQSLDNSVSGRICVDSFPLMEKAVAQKAGIGWIGKHTNLIIKKKGSYFFLGEILLSLELPPDEPLTTDYCGTCNRCQVACPTNALEEAFVLDARRCISYLTIEHDGEIDPELQPGMENWVFGCDICQAVCPWNRFSESGSETDFESRIPDHYFDLRRLRELDREDFERLFEGTPIRRSGYDNFKRNVNIALANKDEAPIQE